MGVEYEEPASSFAFFSSALAGNWIESGTTGLK